MTIAGSLILVLVDQWHSSGAALYVTALTAAIFFAGYTLLALVLSRHATERTKARSGVSRS